MDTNEIISRIRRGEDSVTQFKRQAVGVAKLADEMVAFANAEGGVILFGVSCARNATIASFAAKELPYRGFGTGVKRAVEVIPDIQFEPDRDANWLKTIVKRTTQADSTVDAKNSTVDNKNSTDEKENSTVVGENNTDEVIGTIPKLSKSLQRLVEALGSETLGSRELLVRLNQKSRGALQQTYIQPAIRAGLIEVIGELHSSTRRYRLRIQPKKI